MIKDGQYYSYIMLEDANKISLTNFKDSTGNSFSEIENIRAEDGGEQGVTGITTYSEEYRFIINFSNSASKIENGTYYPMINVNDGKDEQGDAIWIDEKEKENTNNIVVTIQKRTNSFVYETYEGTDMPEKITTSTISLEQEQTVTANFGSRVPEGTYRILFELYDKYGNKKTESFVNFIVLKP